MTTETDLHLLDLLDRAKIEAPATDHVAVERIIIHRIARTTLFSHPPSRILFPSVRLQRGSYLRCSIGVKSSAWDRMSSPVEFSIELRRRFRSKKVIFQAQLDPSVNAQDRQELEITLDLGEYEHQTIQLAFSTYIPGDGDPSYAWAFWGEPILENSAWARHRPPHRPTPAEVVFLVTADALRADHLGCYGHPVIRTPNIDRLAADGWLFEHARTQSPATNASYASLLTGLYPFGHGILTEWGNLGENVNSLPSSLRGTGFGTVFAPSEAELADPRIGFSQHFDHTLPTLGRPMQDGEMTIRRLSSYLDEESLERGFIWLHLFDTHPPAALPAPFHSKYYPGEPTDPANRDHPEWVAEIRGMESVLDIRRALHRLEQGKPDIPLALRLQATGRALRDEGFAPPDLAVHLKALPSTAVEPSKLEFTARLDGWTDSLFRGEVPQDLLSWLRATLPALQLIEGEVLAWLEGVVDYRYAVRQYWAQVSYLDHLVGELVRYLSESGLYERSTIFLTSPHGELLGERGIRFHHHTLQEASLRVPLIFKPDGRRSHPAHPKPGSRIRGTMDLIDIYPTLLDWLELCPPSGIHGKSRLVEILEGELSPDRESYTVGNHGIEVAVQRADHKLIYPLVDMWQSEAWKFFAGEPALFQISGDRELAVDEPADNAQSLQALSGSILGWLHESGGMERFRSQIEASSS